MDLRDALETFSPQHAIGPGVSWPDDWRAFLRTRVNILVTGPDAALKACLRAARPVFRAPVRSVACGNTLALEAGKTLILRDVDKLGRDAQRILFAWMGDPEHADTQIVSTASGPVFPLVQTHGFDQDLYYRLNTICLAAHLPQAFGIPTG
jgi:hypothetical protein